MDDSADAIRRILELDIRLQRQVYAGWPSNWVEVKWPVGTIRALLLISSGYAETPGQVAELLKVSRTTMTGVLDRLEGEGLISRRIHPDDRRSFALELTAAGRELVGQIDSWRLGQLKEALALLDGESLTALEKGLQALTEAMAARRQPESVVEQNQEEGQD